jgi:diguanylate cyclase (GGDEF)-like protein
VVTWSPEVFKIHGLNAETPRSLTRAIDSYHPDDRNLVTEKLDHAIKHQCGFEFTGRIIRPSGEIRHVLSRGEFEKGMLHGSAGMFGIIQDITSQFIYERDLLAASALARQAANDAKQMAETDQLTGIANRRRISAELEMEIANSTKHGRPLAVAIFDIDHFKQINDRFGHHAGDEVLKRVATDAERELRSDDMLGRFGGEEFVIIFPGAGSNIALMVAERVRRTIEAGGANPSVTVSIGVAEFAQGETAETILRRADEALYAAKADGRNMLRLAS